MSVLREGILDRNPAWVQLLGLCPLLAVTSRVSTAIGLGLATLAVMVATNVTVSLSRRWIRSDVRLPAYVLLIATLVTIVELVFRAWWHELHLQLGIFLPLIVTNCAILARAESYASQHGVIRSLIDGLAHGTGFFLALVALGAVRELLAYGSLLGDVGMLSGSGERSGLSLLDIDSGFLLAALPPGAFVALGLLVAAHRWLTARRQSATTAERQADE